MEIIILRGRRTAEKNCDHIHKEKHEPEFVDGVKVTDFFFQYWGLSIIDKIMSFSMM